MSQCPDCRNEFAQPFVCTTCGAQKLYDVTLQSAQDEIERLRTLLAECRPHVVDAKRSTALALGYASGSCYEDEMTARKHYACNALLDRIDAAVKS